MGVATYVKTKTWKDGESGNTPIYASDLNHIEDGILANNAAIKVNETAIATLNSNIIQNGYSKVAGGKNLLSASRKTSSKSGFVYTPTPISSGSGELKVLHLTSGKYTMSWSNDNPNGNFAMEIGSVSITKGTPSASYNSISFSVESENDYTLTLYFNAAYDIYNIQIEKGEIATQYEPYYPSNLMLEQEKQSNRRTRTNITTNLSNLSKAVAEQNLEKYGYSIGDYFTGESGYEYTLADMDTYYGGYNNNAVVSTHHVGILVNAKQQSKYQESGGVTSYAGSTLHSFLTTTVLDKVKSDFTTLFGNWNNHLLAHNLLNNAIDDWGTPTWIENNYIEALTEVQIYGSQVFGSDSYQTGTGCKKLTVFDKFRYNQILGNIYIWLRSLFSASVACSADGRGHARSASVGDSDWVVALILFY